MCLAQGPQRSDAGEARTRGRSVSSQALYHYATALPDDKICEKNTSFDRSMIKLWEPVVGIIFYEIHLF